MNHKIPRQDSNYDDFCEQEILKSYKEAAEYDDFIFGDYNYPKEWICNNSNDVK